MRAVTGACLARAGHTVGAQADGHFGGAAGVDVAQRPQVRRGICRRRVGAKAVNAQLLQAPGTCMLGKVSGSLQGKDVSYGAGRTNFAAAVQTAVNTSISSMSGPCGPEDISCCPVLSLMNPSTMST
jgi:hypothetical protein